MSKINRHLDNSMPILERLAKIKKLFSSSATFWSVTRILMPFLLSQFIALGWNQKFSTIAMEFVKDTPEWVQSILSLIVGYFEKSGDWLFVWVVLFLIVLMVFVKLIEKEENTKHGFFFFSSFLLIGMTFWFYFLPQNEHLAKENSKKLEEIHQDKKVNNYLVDEVKLEREKYVQLQHQFDALRESVREIVSNDREIIDNANEILERDGVEGAIFYLQIKLYVLKALQKQEKEKFSVNTSMSIDKKEDNTTQLLITVTTDKIVTIDGLIYENASFSEGYTWEEAKDYCSEKDNWRLPTRKELYKLSKHDEHPRRFFSGDSDGKPIDEGFNISNMEVIGKSVHELLCSTSILTWSTEEKDSSTVWSVLLYSKEDCLVYKEEESSVICVPEKQISYFPKKEKYCKIYFTK